MPDPKNPKPFAEKAAQFSLYAPIICFVLSFVSSAGQQGPTPPSVAKLQGAFCLALIAAGLIMGVVALFGVRCHGSKRILGRALTGLAFNGLVLATAAAVLPAARRASAASAVSAAPVAIARAPQPPTRASVAGRWHTEARLPDGRKLTADVRFNIDGTFQMDINGDASNRMGGSWSLEDGDLFLYPKSTSRGQAPSSTKEGLGRIKQITPDRMVLETWSGEQVYHRDP